MRDTRDFVQAPRAPARFARSVRGLVALGGLAVAPGAHADPKVSVADGLATLTLERTFVDGTPTVTLTARLPRDWTAEVLGSGVEVVPPDARLGVPHLRFEVRMDNGEPSAVEALARAELDGPKTRVPGGGTVTRVVTDTRALDLGAGTRGFVSTYEIDAREARGTAYVSTQCAVWSPGEPFVVRVDGFAHLGEGATGVAAAFESICESIAIADRPGGRSNAAP